MPMYDLRYPLVISLIFKAGNFRKRVRIVIHISIYRLVNGRSQ